MCAVHNLDFQFVWTRQRYRVAIGCRLVGMTDCKSHRRQRRLGAVLVSGTVHNSLVLGQAIDPSEKTVPKGSVVGQ